MLRMIAAIGGQAAAAGACLVLASTASWADPAQLAQSVSDYKAASAEIVALLETVQDPATAAATAPQILAATERRNQAEAAIQAAMQDMDPNNQEQGSQIQQAFQEVQTANQAVADAQMQAVESQTTAGAKQ